MGAMTTTMAAATQVAAETHATLRESGTAPTPVVAGGSRPAAAPYAKRDRVGLSEACTGFTDTNYRTMAVNAPGDDAHLYAACGQAFELYDMYLNAVRKGDSESESLRTHQAHMEAAENAKNYYETRRAN